MFPDTTPLVNGPSAPATTTASTGTYTLSPSYLTPSLSPSQMLQASPYTQYQTATQDMQKQMQNMRLGGVGSMVSPSQSSGGSPQQTPGPFGQQQFQQQQPYG